MSAFMKVYEIKTDATPNFNQNDFVDAEWLSPKAIMERLKNGDKAKGDLPKLIALLYIS